MTGDYRGAEKASPSCHIWLIKQVKNGTFSSFPSCTKKSLQHIAPSYSYFYKTKITESEKKSPHSKMIHCLVSEEEEEKLLVRPINNMLPVSAVCGNIANAFVSGKPLFWMEQQDNMHMKEFITRTNRPPPPFKFRTTTIWIVKFILQQKITTEIHYTATRKVMEGGGLVVLA